MKVSFKPKFVRQFKKLPAPLQEEVREKIALFKADPHHPYLKTHKLRGHLADSYSFSVNYSYRIVFEYLSKTEAILLCIGDHDVYK